MNENIIISILFTIGFLFMVIFFKVAKLYSSAQKESVNNDGVTSMLSAQSFVDDQLRDVLLDLNTEKFKLHNEKFKESIGLYFTGAIEMIGKQSECNAQSRRLMVVKILHSRLNLTSIEMSKIYAAAFKRKQIKTKNCIMGLGAKAALLWLSESDIPENISLASQLREFSAVAA